MFIHIMTIDIEQFPLCNNLLSISRASNRLETTGKQGKLTDISFCGHLWSFMVNCNQTAIAPQLNCNCTALEPQANCNHRLFLDSSVQGRKALFCRT